MIFMFLQVSGFIPQPLLFASPIPLFHGMTEPSCRWSAGTLNLRFQWFGQGLPEMRMGFDKPGDVREILNPFALPSYSPLLLASGAGRHIFGA